MTAVLSRKAEKWEVFLDGRIRKDAQLLSVTQVVGAKGLNQATFEIRPGGSSLPKTMRDTSHGAGFRPRALFPTRVIDFFKNVYCEVRRGRDGRRVHIGQISSGSLSFDPKSEAITATSRLDEHITGSTIYGKKYRGGYTKEPIIFNPTIDGEVAPNMVLDSGEFLFENEYSTYLPAYLPAGFTEPWTLETITRHMLFNMYSFPRIVNDPPDAELTALFFGDKTEIKDFRLPYGMYLYEALDSLLNPHGYFHYVDMAGLIPTLRFYKRGTTKPISLGTIGDRSMDKPRAVSMDVEIDHCDKAVNYVSLIGSPLLIEGTFVLTPAWNYNLDSTSIDKLRRDSKEWNDDNELSRVFRDWILEEDDPRFQNKMKYQILDRISKVLGTGLPFEPVRPYKFLPMITSNDDLSPLGPHHGCLIEWFNGKYWQDISGGTTGDTTYAGLREASSVKLLKRECGIRFDGLTPPLQLKAMADANPREGGNSTRDWGFKIRITACIQLETRLTAFANGTAPGKSNLTRLKSLDMEVDGYEFRFIMDEGDFKSIFARSSTDPRVHKTTARNDKAALQNLANELLAKWNHSTLKGPITLQGADWITEPLLGRQLKDLPDRNLNFEMNPIASVARKYPDIVSVIANFQDQTTTLNLEAFQ